MSYPPVTITEDVETYNKVMSEMRERLHIDEPREGVHVSDLIYCLRKSWMLQRLDKEPEGRFAYTGQTPDETVLVWMVGHSHEAIFGQSLARGVPVESDGIVGTPDFWDEALIEMKSTRMSAKKTPEEMGHYVAQVASYCAMQGLKEGRLYVLHIMGDYGHPPNAKLRIWKLQFKPKDLKAWWEELQRRRDIVLGKKMPPPAPCWDWECGYCAVRSLIDCPGNETWQREQAKKNRKQSLDQPEKKLGA